MPCMLVTIIVAVNIDMRRHLEGRQEFIDADASQLVSPDAQPHMSQPRKSQLTVAYGKPPCSLALIQLDHLVISWAGVHLAPDVYVILPCQIDPDRPYCLLSTPSIASHENSHQMVPSRQSFLQSAILAFRHTDIFVVN